MDMAVWEFRNYLERLLDDAQLTDITRVIDATNAALNALVVYEPKLSVAHIEGDGELASFPLPDDFYWYSGFFKADGSRIEVLWPANSDYLLPTGEYIALMYPSGQVTFTPRLSAGEHLTLYYYARWAKVTDENSVIEPPAHWLNALAYYATAELLIADALIAAGVRQYNTRIDSGNPEHNPVHKQVLAMRAMFMEEVARHSHITIKTNA